MFENIFVIPNIYYFSYLWTNLGPKGILVICLTNLGSIPAKVIF